MGVPKEVLKADSMLQPALFGWPAALTSQLGVLIVPKAPASRILQPGVVWRAILFLTLVWTPGVFVSLGKEWLGVTCKRT